TRCAVYLDGKPKCQLRERGARAGEIFHDQLPGTRSISDDNRPQERMQAQLARQRRRCQSARDFSNDSSRVAKKLSACNGIYTARRGERLEYDAASHTFAPDRDLLLF